MKHGFTHAVALAAMAILVGGCGWFETSTEKSEDKKTVSVSFNQQDFERDRAEYQRQMEQKYDDLNARMEVLHDQAKVAAGDAKANLDKEIATQQVNLEKARGELKEIQSATAEKWADVKARSSAAFDDLQQGIEKALSRFK